MGFCRESPRKGFSAEASEVGARERERWKHRLGEGGRAWLEGARGAWV